MISEKSARGSTYMPKSLLVADDSLTIRKVIGMILSAEDFQITSVDNGLEAVNKAKELRPDLVLADVMMPGKSGYEVCDALKGDPSTKAIPVLLLAGSFEPFDEGRARSVKADDFIVKPFESQALLDKVRTLTGLPKEPETPRKIFVPEAAAHLPKASVQVAEPVRPAISIPVPATAPARPVPAPAVARPQGVPQTTMPRVAAPALASAPGVGRAPAPNRPPGVRPNFPSVPPNPAVPQYRMPNHALPRTGAVPQPAAVARQQPGVYGTVRNAAHPTAPAVQPYAQGPVSVGAAYARVPTTGAARIPGAGGYPAIPQAGPVARSGTPTVPGSAPRNPAAGQARPRADDGGEAMVREALSKASREVIEKIAWEIVPQLAETIIREHLDQLMKDRSGRS
jgi:CheY-like chemotaxis protein